MNVQRVLASGMEIGYKELGIGQSLPWHVHDAPSLCVVVGGQVKEQYGLRVRDRRRGDVVFQPQPLRHRDLVTGSRLQILTLELRDSAMGALEDLGLPRRDPVFTTSSRAARLARLAQAELPDDDPAAELELMGFAYELLSIVLRRPGDTGPQPPRWVRRLHDSLRDEFRTTPTLRELAAREGVSPYRLSRAFRQHYGMSIGAFLRRVRVDHAMELLAAPDLPLVEVALSSGFYDQSHLTNVFKRHTGLTPAIFRRRVTSGSTPIDR